MAVFHHITDFADKRLDLFARWNENQLRSRADPSHAMFIAESPMVIERALESGCRPLSFLLEEKDALRDHRDLLQRCPDDIPVYTAAAELLKGLTGFALTRGMLCAMLRPALPSVSDLCRGAKRLAVLENVVNPTNVGAIFRSAAALNMDAVLLTADCSDPLYRRSIRVSMGTVFQIPWTYLPPDETVNDALHREGFLTAAMALKEDSLDIASPLLQTVKHLAVLLGTEGYGLPDETIRQCDYTVRIPMSHGVDSLNVAAASAVAFYQLAARGR